MVKRSLRTKRGGERTDGDRKTSLFLSNSANMNESKNKEKEKIPKPLFIVVKIWKHEWIQFEILLTRVKKCNENFPNLLFIFGSDQFSQRPYATDKTSSQASNLR